MKRWAPALRRAGGNITVPAPLPIHLAALVLVCTCPPFSRGQGPRPALRQVRLEMVFSSSLFPVGNRNDAVAAVGVWTSMFGRRRGFQAQTTIEVVDNVAEARNLVLVGTLGQQRMSSAGEGAEP